MKKIVLIGTLFVLNSFFASAQIYVDKDATGASNGTSWTNAYTDLQPAIDAAAAGDEIWVAAGTYLPTEAPDGTAGTGITGRINTFHLNKNLKIYGGFAGTETVSSSRDAATNVTILSGDFSGNDVVSGSGSTLSITNNTENAYHVLITTGLNSTTLIDGFNIRGGNANGGANISYEGSSFNQGIGGGMFNASSSPSLVNVTFSGNSATTNGGGMFNSSSSPSLTEVSFFVNSATTSGGGLYNDRSSPSLSNVTFSGNLATSNGGGLYNDDSSPSLINVTFSRNSATTSGGGLYNDDSSPSLINTTFFGNSANNGGGMNNRNLSSPILYNTLFHSNTAGTSGSDISGAIINSSSSHNASDGFGGSINTGTGFVNLIGVVSNVLFSNPLDPDGADDILRTSDDGIHLLAGSVLVGVGSPTIAPLTDSAGTTRPNPPSIGAYEVIPPPCTTANRLYVNHAATGNNTGESWANAFTGLQDALDCATAGKEIWVAAGTYTPTTAPDDSTADNRDRAFHFNTNLKLYGGFAGTETVSSSRDAATNMTILSGDFNNDDAVSGSGSTLSITNNTENAYHVLITTGLNSTTLIDGFNIRGGNANGSSSDISYGGSLFNRQSGGGLYNDRSSPSLTQVTFSGNTAFWGGGMFNQLFSYPSLVNITFSGNTAAILGGGMFNIQSSPSLINVTFFGNMANNDGGGMYNLSSSPTLYNTLFHNNTAGTGPDISGDSINSSSSHNASNGAGGSISTGTGFVNLSALDSNTLFSNPLDPDGADDIWRTTDDGIHLLAGSVLVGVGSPTIAPLTDSAGTTRPNPPSIGAYEAIVSVETQLSLVGGVLTIEDAAGGNSNDDLTLTVSGTLLILHDSLNVLGGAGTAVNPNTRSIPLSSISSIVIDTQSGTDSVTLSASLAFTGNGGIQVRGNANVTQTASMTLENGQISYQVSGTIRLQDNAITVTGSGTVLLMATVDVILLQSIRSLANGDIHLVSGWDGTTAFDLAIFNAFSSVASLTAATPFGNNNGTVSLGDGTQTSSITIGSKEGATAVFGFNIVLTAGNGGTGRFAQLGFQSSDQGSSYTISGTISLRLKNNLRLNGGNSGAFNYAQIGHIGADTTSDSSSEGRVTANIVLAVGGNIVITGGAELSAFAQLGHGGYNAIALYLGIYQLLTPEVRLSLEDGSGNGYSRLGND